MAKGINKVILIGNLGADPDKGKNFTKVTLAVGSFYKDKTTGEQVDKTEWIKIVFFGRLADIAAQYLTKGSKVYIEGSLQTSTFEKEGQTHYSTSVVASELQMLDSKSSNGEKSIYKTSNVLKQSSWPAEKLSGPEAAKKYTSFEDSDLPF